MLKWIVGRWKSFGYALRGVGGVITSGPNMRIMLVAFVVVVGAGIYFRIDKHDWALVTIAITLVLFAEAFNTAIECLTDMVQPNHDPRAGDVKDLASAGVLITAIGAAVIGWLVFGKYLLL